ncbi:hypothetical protein [Paenibacillus tarimensis]|uniref:hypothetical protein n=1 Tax=Paenibacillus tarimensis TaxID=416012 RepID=UPI001F1DE837|nr:hypothetical protein [Paenibacillus tarimensis]
MNVRKRPKLVIALTICLLPVALNYILFSWKMPGLVGDLNSWMGFISNYSGGIIGGIVAFIITKSQIQAQKEENKINRMIDQLPYVTKLRFEINKLKENLNSIKRISEGSKGIQDLSTPSELAKGLSGTLFLQGILSERRYTPLFLDKLDKQIWNEVHFINDIQLQTKVIETFNTFDNIFNTLQYDLPRKWIRLDEVDKLIERLKSKDDKSITEIEQLRKYHNEYSNLLLQNNIYSNKKHQVWDGLFQNNFYFETIEEVSSVIDEKINEINILLKTK